MFIDRILWFSQGIEVVVGFLQDVNISGSTVSLVDHSRVLELSESYGAGFIAIVNLIEVI